MKSIADFVEGKIVRLEVGGQVSFVRGGEPHPEHGDREGVLTGPGGAAVLYQRGMTAGEVGFAYDRIERVELSASEDGGRAVAIFLPEGAVRLRSSETGGEVLYATLRWIGHTILRRKIAP